MKYPCMSRICYGPESSGLVKIKVNTTTDFAVGLFTKEGFIHSFLRTLSICAKE